VSALATRLLHGCGQVLPTPRKRDAAAPTGALTRTALSLVGSTLTTSVLGVGFWALADRIYPARVVGIDSALIAVMVTFSAICQLNLTNVLVRFLPQVRWRIGWRVLQAYGTAAAASLLVGVAFVLVAPSVSPHFDLFRDNALLAACFVFGLTAWTVFSLEDAVLIALRRPTWLPIENGLFGVAKIALLPITLAVVGMSGHAIFLSWVIPMWATVPIINWLLARRVIPEARSKQSRAPSELHTVERRRLAAFLGQDLVGNALGQVTTAVIPILVVALLGPVANAYFFIPFTLVTAFDLLFLAVATSVVAEGARGEHPVGRLVKSAIGRFLSLQAVAAVLVIVFAPFVLQPFGPAYVQHGTTPLRLLIAASCFRSSLWMFSSIARLQRRGRALLLVDAACSFPLIALILLAAPRWGTDGIAAAWLIVNVVVGTAVLPFVLSVSRAGGDGHRARSGMDAHTGALT
jgi:O-antigen/teichoic acid export membrane protein